MVSDGHDELGVHEAPFHWRGVPVSSSTTRSRVVKSLGNRSRYMLLPVRVYDTIVDGLLEGITFHANWCMPAALPTWCAQLDCRAAQLVHVNVDSERPDNTPGSRLHITALPRCVVVTGRPTGTVGDVALNIIVQELIKRVRTSRSRQVLSHPLQQRQPDSGGAAPGPGGYGALRPSEAYCVQHPNHARPSHTLLPVRVYDTIADGRTGGDYISCKLVPAALPTWCAELDCLAQWIHVNVDSERPDNTPGSRLHIAALPRCVVVLWAIVLLFY